VGLCLVMSLDFLLPRSPLSADAKRMGKLESPASSFGRWSSPIGLKPNGQLLMAGRALRCGHVRNVLDPNLDNLGVAARGVIVFNPHLLDHHPDAVRLFVFHHECGHHHVGSNEISADCWAVKRGVAEGWLNHQGMEQVCRSFGSDPATSTHPSGPKRCASLQQCYAITIRARTKEKSVFASPRLPTYRRRS
jgi:hypothetical protein